jgi:hypothetical protein
MPDMTTPSERLRELADRLDNAAWTLGGAYFGHWRDDARALATEVEANGGPSAASGGAVQGDMGAEAREYLHRARRHPRHPRPY